MYTKNSLSLKELYQNKFQFKVVQILRLSASNYEGTKTIQEVRVVSLSLKVHSRFGFHCCQHKTAYEVTKSSKPGTLKGYIP